MWRIVGWEELQDAPLESKVAPSTSNVTQFPAEDRSSSTINENQMRIMRQSTLNYAAILIAPISKDFATPQLMVERTIDLSAKLLEYVISGEMPQFSDDEQDLFEQDI